MYLLRKTGYSSNVANTNNGTIDYVPNPKPDGNQEYLDSHTGIIDYIPNESYTYTEITIDTTSPELVWETVTTNWEKLNVNWEIV